MREPQWWLVGLIVGGIAIVGWIALALIYRLLVILVGEDAATVGLILAPILAAIAAFVEWWTSLKPPTSPAA